MLGKDLTGWRIVRAYSLSLVLDVMAQTPLVRTDKGHEEINPVLFCLSAKALEIAWDKLISSDERNRRHAYVTGHLFLYNEVAGIGLNLSAEESNLWPVFTDELIYQMCTQDVPFRWAPGPTGSDALRDYKPDFNDVG
ncbi:hypothetical protein HOF40_00250 [Candidatus Parcubacteria bacterium]|nr:hypothetical protein [Candidatus Parcubacteria bacterium]MBT3948502.1 hypothetical protein [Candidatus Parcubacteria bacterium]